MEVLFKFASTYNTFIFPIEGTVQNISDSETRIRFSMIFPSQPQITEINPLSKLSPGFKGYSYICPGLLCFIFKYSSSYSLRLSSYDSDDSVSSLSLETFSFKFLSSSGVSLTTPFEIYFDCSSSTISSSTFTLGTGLLSSS